MSLDDCTGAALGAAAEGNGRTPQPDEREARTGLTARKLCPHV